MARTIDLGDFFYHLAWFRSIDGSRVPIVGRVPSQEIEAPFRRSIAFFVRLPIVKFGVVLGKWSRSAAADEEEALLAAISGYGLDIYDDVDLTDPTTRATIRANIAANTESWDEEWEVINAFGVVE